jgi:glycine cleavage system aminomethyltransferase T
MFMPTMYKSNEEDYKSLVEDVSIWDVAAERQVQIEGEDAAEFVQYLTPRNLSTFKDSFCRYCLLTDENGGIVNDPLVLKFSKNKYWLSIADTDVLLWCKAIALHSKFRVTVTEPEACPLALQGPKSFDMMREISEDNEAIMNLKYYQFVETKLFNIPVVVARSGWSNQNGYEIYIKAAADGNSLWDKLMEAGQSYKIAPGSPNQIDRMEAGMISHLGDTTLEDNPLELNLPKFCDLDQEADFIGKDALKKIRDNGIKKQFTGFKISGKNIGYNLRRMPLIDGNNINQGFISSCIYSPTFGCNIGIGFVKIDKVSSTEIFKAVVDDEERDIEIVALPFSSRLEKMK